MEVTARLSSKGQITVPRAVREALSLEEGDRLVFRVQGDHALLTTYSGSAGPRWVGQRAGRQARHAVGGGTGPDTAGTGYVETVTAFVDTNVLVRHLTGDPPSQAIRATRYLQRADELLLPDLILAEVAYVLESFYETPRAHKGPRHCERSWPSRPSASSTTNSCSGRSRSTRRPSARFRRRLSGRERGTERHQCRRFLRSRHRSHTVRRVEPR